MVKRKVKLLVLLAIIIVLILTTVFSILFIQCIESPENLRKIIEAKGGLAPLAFILLSMIQIIIPFIPGEPFELLAGYTFGTIKGSLLCFIAGTISSIFIILLVRKYGTKIVELFFTKKEYGKLNFLKRRNAFLLYSLVFILPGTPKDLLCYVGGLTKFDLIPLLFITTIGRIPGIITSTLPADIAGNRNYVLAIITYLITIIISIIGALIYKKIKNQK